MLKTIRPSGANLWAIFQIVTVLRAVISKFCTDKRKILQESVAKFYVYPFLDLWVNEIPA